MKGRVIFIISIAVLSILAIGSGNVNAATVAGTKHDLTAVADGASACSFCHGAHDSSDGQLALWARSTPQSEFTLYDSATMDSVMGAPSGISLACLSCHDGVTAFDALRGSVGTAGNNMSTVIPGSPAIIGLDLGDDHPVGVDITLDSVGINDESTITAAGLKIYDSKVECASCHDVHGDAGYAYFLRLDPDFGSLCSTCHKK
jgi:hypothetical protein